MAQCSVSNAIPLGLWSACGPGSQLLAQAVSLAAHCSIRHAGFHPYQVGHSGSGRLRVSAEATHGLATSCQSSRPSPLRIVCAHCVQHLLMTLTAPAAATSLFGRLCPLRLPEQERWRCVPTPCALDLVHLLQRAAGTVPCAASAAVSWLKPVSLQQ